MIVILQCFRTNLVKYESKATQVNAKYSFKTKSLLLRRSFKPALPCVGKWSPSNLDNRLGHHYSSNWSRGILVDSPNTSEGSWATFSLTHYNISMTCRSGLWLGHSKVFVLLFFSQSEVDLLVCFGSFSSCRSQVGFSLRPSNRHPDGLLQDVWVDSRIYGSVWHSQSSRSWSSL